MGSYLFPRTPQEGSSQSPSVGYVIPSKAERNLGGQRMLITAQIIKACICWAAPRAGTRLYDWEQDFPGNMVITRSTEEKLRFTEVKKLGSGPDWGLYHLI